MERNYRLVTTKLSPYDLPPIVEMQEDSNYNKYFTITFLDKPDNIIKIAESMIGVPEIREYLNAYVYIKEGAKSPKEDVRTIDECIYNIITTMKNLKTGKRNLYGKPYKLKYCFMYDKAESDELKFPIVAVWEIDNEKIPDELIKYCYGYRPLSYNPTLLKKDINIFSGKGFQGFSFVSSNITSGEQSLIRSDARERAYIISYDTMTSFKRLLSIMYGVTLDDVIIKDFNTLKQYFLRILDNKYEYMKALNDANIFYNIKYIKYAPFYGIKRDKFLQEAERFEYSKNVNQGDLFNLSQYYSYDFMPLHKITDITGNLDCIMFSFDSNIYVVADMIKKTELYGNVFEIKKEY